MTNSSTIVTAHRGGRAVMFIYIGVFLICAPFGTLLKIQPYSLWIAISLLAVAAGSFLPKYIFSKPVITADSNGLWTQKLGTVGWAEVKNIYEERTQKSPFSTSVVNTDIYLYVECNDGRREKFDLLYLNVDYNTFLQALKNLWQKHIRNEDRTTT